MKRRRIYPNEKGGLTLAEGDYGFDGDGVFWCRPPGSHAGVVEGEGWTITQHEDGAVSVNPSIDTGEWHGHLIKGEFIK